MYGAGSYQGNIRKMVLIIFDDKMSLKVERLVYKVLKV